ncbi:MAG: hypothetical protein EP347_04530 [Alphaproteobacteria bacterium]|nr:MAG: hypothetical protein EP347_04530 [Alphaproteobacteria bacterium]
MRLRFKLAGLLAVVGYLASACSHSQPTSREVANACDILDDRKSWYHAMQKAEKRWGTPVHVQLAIMKQESNFDRSARPPRTKVLWVVPGPRKSSAYGFAQAKNSTWDWYKRSTGRSGADRNNFADAADFISWYGYQSKKMSGIAQWDTYNLYLAYHEGQGGYNKGTYRGKDWLLNVAHRVSSNASLYQTQLSSCEGRLRRRGFF